MGILQLGLKVLENLLLSAHVLAGILFVGPVAVTTSLFPRFAPVAAGTADPLRPVRAQRLGGPELHRRDPGLRRAGPRGAGDRPGAGRRSRGAWARSGSSWRWCSPPLAGGLLALRITPGQRAALESPGDAARLRGLSMPDRCLQPAVGGGRRAHGRAAGVGVRPLLRALQALSRPGAPERGRPARQPGHRARGGRLVGARSDARRAVPGGSRHRAARPGPPAAHAGPGAGPGARRRLHPAERADARRADRACAATCAVRRR